jgi:hypothetical protein
VKQPCESSSAVDRARAGALEQQLALAAVARERRGSLELGARLLRSAELEQKVGR